MLTKKKKNKQLITLVETLPKSMHDFLGSESDVYFQRRCRLKFVLPYRAMLTETKKIVEKIKKFKILKTKMV